MQYFNLPFQGVNGTDTIPGVLPLAILMRPVGAKQQGLSALYLGFQPPNALTHPSFSGWLFSTLAAEDAEVR
ncbi:hypothetical protein [Candidatus Venteria ishoeyi]|uniref:Uncharacterized protein n=1 Tax=Candidatus Venteria ishoeyi TaxID=1899563 RepID=A0A1H6FGB1_9GAMM|nr:hypothetical protein [Candidatus Venteria ishoeyi]MDM8546474.1 hypothetical protein [Candidatus Venteria ishoeyi]SEH08075.1 Uncharacterised protein [Candidatus Venteria ishoeyi]